MARPEDRRQLDCRIVVTDRIPATKLTLDVELPGKPSEQDLRELASRIYAEERGSDYEWLGVSFLIPEIPEGEGCWATARFDPSLDLRILGMTAEQERAFLAEPRDPSTVGRWLDQGPGIVGAVELLERDGTLVLQRRFTGTDADASSSGAAYTTEVRGTVEGDSIRIDEVGGNDFGEYYVIEPDGVLSMCNSEGVFRTAAPY